MRFRSDLPCVPWQGWKLSNFLHLYFLQIGKRKDPFRLEGVFSFWVEIESCLWQSHGGGEQEFNRGMPELSSELWNCAYLALQFHRFKFFRRRNVWLNTTEFNQATEAVQVNFVVPKEILKGMPPL